MTDPNFVLAMLPPSAVPTVRYSVSRISRILLRYFERAITPLHTGTLGSKLLFLTGAGVLCPLALLANSLLGKL